MEATSGELAMARAGAKYTRELPWTRGRRVPKRMWRMVERPVTMSTAWITSAVFTWRAEWHEGDSVAMRHKWQACVRNQAQLADVPR